MTDKELGKRLAELRDEFGRMCIGRLCKDCELHPIVREGCTCADAYIWKKMMAETCWTLDGCPAAQKKEAAAAAPLAEKEQPLPKWVKEGAWVFHNGCHLGKIEGFEKVPEDGSTPPTTYVIVTSYDTHNKLLFTRLPKQIQPIRFRPYTFEEAKDLTEVTYAQTTCGMHSGV